MVAVSFVSTSGASVKNGFACPKFQVNKIWQTVSPLTKKKGNSSAYLLSSLSHEQNQLVKSNRIRTRKIPLRGQRQLKIRTVSATSAQTIDFEVRTKTSRGDSLLIRPLEMRDTAKLSVLLARSFTESTGTQAYNKYFERKIASYLRDRVGTPAREAVCLVAVVLNQRGENEEDQSEGEMVGTSEVSFSPLTRSINVTLAPPDDAPYLSNMAVLESYRRCGIGSSLIAASEDVCKIFGAKNLYLHCRVIDLPATELYLSQRYSPENTDLWFMKFVPSYERRILMKKQL